MVIVARGNIKLKISPLGEIELKFVAFGDLDEIAKIVNDKSFSDQDVFCVILNRQIVPKVNLDKIKGLSNKKLIEIGNKFIKNEKEVFEYFSLKDEDYFKSFRDAITTYYSKQFKELKIDLDPNLISAIRSLEKFQKDYAAVIQRSLNIGLRFSESIKRISDVSTQIHKANLRIADSFKPFIKQFNLFSTVIEKSFKPQINVWQNWVESNKSILDNIDKRWKEFQKAYEITEQKAVGILQKYKWFITPSLPITFIFQIVEIDKRNKGKSYKAVNAFFIKYFSNNKWEKLDLMVESWKKKPLLQRRGKILEDCVQTLKSSDSKKTNVASVILPALIAQIDGMLTDYLNDKGIQWDCAYGDYVRNGRILKKGRKNQFRANKSQLMSPELDDLANDVFLNILFQKSQKGRPLETPFNFNRHKIMHGESVNFGRKDYLVRAFLVLDFLVHLK